MYRKTITALAATLALSVPAVAQAHHVTGGSATCTQVSVNYASFSESNKPISYKVYSDNVLVAQGTGTFPSSSGTITATYPPLAKGTHTIKWTSTWPNMGTQNGGFDTVVADCAGPPVVVTPPAPRPEVPQTAEVAPPVQSAPALPPATPKTVKPKAKRCEFGRRRFDRNGHRLRDSKGRRVTMCIVRHKAPVVVTPKFTG